MLARLLLTYIHKVWEKYLINKYVIRIHEMIFTLMLSFFSMNAMVSQILSNSPWQQPSTAIFIFITYNHKHFHWAIQSMYYFSVSQLNVTSGIAGISLQIVDQTTLKYSQRKHHNPQNIIISMFFPHTMQAGMTPNVSFTTKN